MRIIVTHVALVAVALALGSGVGSVAPGSDVISVWWPAVAVCVLAVLVVPRRWFWLAALSAGIGAVGANLLLGRVPLVAVGYGLANAAEAFVIAQILVAGRARARLATLRDVGRLLFAASAGALVASLIVGTTAAIAGSQFVEIVFPVIASHMAAVLVIVPLGITSRRGGGTSTRWHKVVHVLAFMSVIAVVFGPGEDLPLTFLPMPMLVWAVLLFSTRIVAAEFALIAVVVSTLTSRGEGPFAQALHGPNPVVSAQLFLVVYAVTVLSFAVARDERVAMTMRLAKRDQVLRGGLIDAQVGFVVLEQVGPRDLRVVEANVRAAEMLAGEVVVTRDDAQDVRDESRRRQLLLDEGSPFVRAVLATLDSPVGEWFDEIDIAGFRRGEVFLTRVERTTGGATVTAQIIDVTQRHLADAALQRALADERAAAARLRDLSKQKDGFLSAVSHELRTPITSIVGYTELLVDDTPLDEEQERYLEIIERNARRLGVLVEDLLELGAAQAQRLDDEAPVVTALDETVRHTIEEHIPQASARGVRLIVGERTGLGAHVVKVDLERILTNLISNAVKFTPADGTVTTDVRAQGQDVILRVADTGPGISSDEIERVFDRFYRSMSTDERQVPGVGLGLALVRNLVERNGGRIWLESDGEHGTEAFVRLRSAGRAARPTSAEATEASTATAPEVSTPPTT
ncbi:ATP-binding protein [Sanguibacter sp. A247]|uniref:ATP-binding protein n=1 Tax=unclassified Sanguibacter TaxID=2645534 RepID=UPI003FD8D3AF